MKLVLTAAVFFIIGVSVSYFLNKPQPVQVSSVKTIATETPKPLGFTTSVKTSKGTVYLWIDQNFISFNPYETAINNNKYITIKKEEYPKLFQQGIANFSVLEATEYTEPNTNKEYVKLSDLKPDHGGYASTYSLLVDPFTGEIKETANDYETRQKLRIY